MRNDEFMFSVFLAAVVRSDTLVPWTRKISKNMACVDGNALELEDAQNCEPVI